MDTLQSEVAPLSRIHSEIESLYSEALGEGYGSNWEGKNWLLYLTECPGPWLTITVTVAHLESRFCAELPKLTNFSQSSHHTVPPRLMGDPETLEALFSYLPLLSLETGALLRRLIRFHGPSKFNTFLYASQLGWESYEVATAKVPVEGKQNHTLKRIPPQDAKEASSSAPEVIATVWV